MAWIDYYADAQRGYDRNDEQVEETWLRAELALLLLMGRLRRRLVGPAGKLDLGNQVAVIKFRGLVFDEVNTFFDDSMKQLIGTSNPKILDPRTPVSNVKGIQGRAIRVAAKAAEEDWKSLVERASRDSLEVVAKVPSPLPTVLREELEKALEELPPLPKVQPIPAAPAPAPAREIKFDPERGVYTTTHKPPTPGSVFIPALGEWSIPEELTDNFDEDDRNLANAIEDALLEDSALARLFAEDGPNTKSLLAELQKELGFGRQGILGGAPDNPWRNVRYQADRVTETAEDLTNRTARRGSAPDMVAFLVGGEEDSRRTRPTESVESGWRLDRGRMRLAIASHVRAVYRRSRVIQGRVYGIQYFRLDAPQRTWGRIAPEGAVGSQLWKVRTWDQWLEIARRANSKRIASSSFDSFGLGYGDETYLTPVCVAHLPDAIRQGAAFREKYMRPRKGQKPAAKAA